MDSLFMLSLLLVSRAIRQDSAPRNGDSMVECVFGFTSCSVSSHYSTGSSFAAQSVTIRDFCRMVVEVNSDPFAVCDSLAKVPVCRRKKSSRAKLFSKYGRLRWELIFVLRFLTSRSSLNNKFTHHVSSTGTKEMESSALKREFKSFPC